MERTIVRINKMHISNIKNTQNGQLEFTKQNDERQAEIIGLYGQNGSGKTATILALDILKTAMSGLGLKNDVYYYILTNQKSGHFKFDFTIEIATEAIEVSYSFDIDKHDENKKASIENEKITYKRNKETSMQTLLEVLKGETKEVLAPRYKFDKPKQVNQQEYIDLMVSKKMASEKSESFIFRDETLAILKKQIKDEVEYNLLQALNFYARFNMFVVLNNHQSHISGDSFLPLFFRVSQTDDDKSSELTSGSIPVHYGVNELDKKAYNLYKNIIKQISSIISEIIPGMSLYTKEYGETTLKDGTMAYRFELMSKRDDLLPIPIKFESDGIKKILSVLSSLIAMFNSRSVLVAIDELDSGIFEYLLGELLEEINDSGKGQLIFTSHNLRPLEVLHYSNVYFTTVNPNNRYIRFTNIKPSNNLRSLYYREIALRATGQKEEVYNEVKMYKVGRAFRKAGELYGSIGR